VALTLDCIAVVLLGMLPAPDGYDEALQQLCARLSPEGTSGRVALLAKSESGLKALRERIDLLLASPLGKARGNARGLFEDYYFSADPDGNFTLRAERRAELEQLKSRVTLSLRRFEIFNRRLDEIGDRILEENEQDKAAKAGWQLKPWRRHFFNTHLAGALVDADHDPRQILDSLLLRNLVTGADGKLRINPFLRSRVTELIKAVYTLMDEAKKHEESYLKLAAKGYYGDTSRSGGSDTAALIVCTFLAQELRKDGGDSMQKLLGLDLKKIHEEVEEILGISDEIRGTLDTLVSRLAEDDQATLDLQLFLKDDRARIVLARRVSPTDDGLNQRLHWFFPHVLPSAWLSSQGDHLVVKRGAYRNERGEETGKAFWAATFVMCESQFRAAHEPFVSIAERCLETDVAALLRNPDALPVLRQEAARIQEVESISIRNQGVAIFNRCYFTEAEGRLVVRPQRLEQIEELFRREEELRKGAEAGKKP
jgi:hypothetical protein